MPESKLTEEQARQAACLKLDEKMALPDGRYIHMTLDESRECFSCDVCALNLTAACADFNCDRMVPHLVNPEADHA